MSSYGVPGNLNVEVCAEHAPNGTVDVKHKRYSHGCCWRRPSWGMAGSRKAEFCAEYDVPDMMVNLRHTQCSHEGCSKPARYGVAGSRKAEFCSEHAPDEMSNVKRSDHGSYSKRRTNGVASSHNIELCKEHVADGMVNVKPENMRTSHAAPKKQSRPLKTLPPLRPAPAGLG